MNDQIAVLRESLATGLVRHREQQAIEREMESMLAEYRSSLENPQTPLSYPDEWLLDAWNGGRTDSGIRVSELTALQVSTAYACVNLISSSIGGLELNVYEHITNSTNRTGKRLAVDHDLFDLLHDEPNEEMSSFTFFRTLQVHALLWSNGYAEIQRDGAGRAVALWPLLPAKTRPIRLRKTQELAYKTSVGMDQTNPEMPSGERIVLASDMIHIPGLSLDGRVGYGTVQLLRQAFGLTLAAEKYGAKLFANNARPGGVLEHPAKMTPEARKTLRDSWALAQAGDNVHRVAVLENGLKYSPMSLKPNEGQFLETRQFQQGQICSIFAVPPHMIGDTEKSNRANTEQLGLEFVSFTLQPWLKNWQSELKRKLFQSPTFGRNAKQKFFPRFDTRPLTMPDAASRQGFYNSGKQWGWLCTNDIHEFEHINPSDQPGAELYWMPINMGVMGADGAVTPKPAAAPADPNAPPDPDKDDTIKRFVGIYSGLFRDALGRLSARSEPDNDAFVRAFEPVLTTMKRHIVTLGSEATVDGELEIPFDSAEYIRGMRKRLDESRAMNVGLSREQMADREVARATKAITIEVYRALATAKAKKQLEEKSANV